MQVTRGVSYRNIDGHGSFNTLDIYHAGQPLGRGRRSVVVFLHGGGWSGGDKFHPTFATSTGLPAFFVSRGCLFVAINFRLALTPDGQGATIPEIVDDVAKALKWLTVNARRFGGSAKELVLLGYSSGAHLAVLAASDGHYLSRYRLSSGDIRGVIALDTPHYDVPRAIAKIETGADPVPNPEQRLSAQYKIFGSRPEDQRALSPATFVGDHMRGTSYLLVSGSRFNGQPRSLSKELSEDFLRTLMAAGISGRHHHVPDLEHQDLLGRFNETMGDEVSEFLYEIGCLPKDPMQSAGTHRVRARPTKPPEGSGKP